MAVATAQTYTIGSDQPLPNVSVAVRLDQIEITLVRAHSILDAVLGPQLGSDETTVRAQGVLADLDIINCSLDILVNRLEGLFRLIDRQL